MLLLEKSCQAFAESPTAKLVACLVLNFTLLVALSSPNQSLAQSPEALQAASQLQTQIDDDLSATDANAYDPAMVEPLFVYARQLQEAGSHTEAVALYREAIHILRINQGLYTEAQIELLDAMIESEISLQNWELVDRHYAYMENLYRRLYDVWDPRLESGLQKVVYWHVKAFNVNIDGKRIEHLQQASKLFKLRLHIAQLTLRTDHPKLAYLHHNIEICERQLFLASDLNREMQRRQQRSRQNSLIADRD